MFRNVKFIGSRICSNFLKQNFSSESIASTIFALSTNIKSSGSAIAVIRISGAKTLSVIDVLTDGRGNVYRENPRKAIFQNLYDPKTSDLIDQAVAIWFPKPKSYTGEDLCEFHVHGSPAVITKMLSVLGEMEGCRPAKEGEFTKRALINGKLNLVQAEGIRDLIHAKTDQQRRRALGGVSGNLDRKFDSWRQTIIKLMAHMEAFIDFSEEELLDPNVMDNLKRDITLVKQEIDNHVKNSKLKSDLIKDGFHIAIVGQPNVGKSSLINKLCEKDLSIISPLSGTTRDIVETWMDIDGNCVRIADTAGIRDLTDSDIVEQQGIQKALKMAKNCHLIIAVFDAKDVLQNQTLTFHTHLKEIFTERHENEILFVANKIDLLSEKERDNLKSILEANQVKNFILHSCLNNEGFTHFIEFLKLKIDTILANSDPETLFSDERHVTHLKEVVKELELSFKHIDLDIAISSFHLRQASYHLGCLTGNITTEHILDVIFKDFCIGK